MTPPPNPNDASPTALVLTLLGPDRPGLVEAVAGVVADHGGSWEESRMARMAGRFAGIARVLVPAAEVATLQVALTALNKSGLSVVAQSTDGESPDGLKGKESGKDANSESDDARRLRLQLVGHDRPGILRDVTRALASVGANVVELNTRIFSAPMSGEQLFEANAMLLAPRELNFSALDEELHGISERLDLDLTLEEIASVRRPHGSTGGTAGDTAGDTTGGSAGA